MPWSTTTLWEGSKRPRAREGRDELEVEIYGRPTNAHSRQMGVDRINALCDINQLDSFAVLERLVGFYVAEHNTKLPHSAFQGQTPDEIYFGRGEDVPEQLAEARRIVRDVRLQTNRGLSCDGCRSPITELGTSRLLPPEKLRISAIFNCDAFAAPRLHNV